MQPLVAACMQRWALIFSAYTYKIENVQGSANQCTDCLSCLPESATSTHPAEKGSKVFAVAIDFSPVIAKLIAKKTVKDAVLAKLVTCICHGTWLSPVPDDVIPYHCQRFSLTVQDGYIIWGKRCYDTQGIKSQAVRRTPYQTYQNLSNENISYPAVLCAGHTP